jgi:putative DNA methylase
MTVGQPGQLSDIVRPKIPQADRRLIEEWLPIAALGIESLRERTPMTPFPAPNRLHVWWARRPLVASRAAVLASLLPADADHKKFLHAVGIHGDAIGSRARIAEAKRTGERFEGQAYTYARAFSFNPTDADREYLRTLGGHGKPPRVLDSTAGGGSIPFEAVRLGCDTHGNDLNPVAWLILKATIEFPVKFGTALLKRYKELAAQFVKLRDQKLEMFFPPEAKPNCVATNWIWARSVRCPYCNGLVPLSPNWKLNTKGVGMRLVPQTSDANNRVCSFEIVHDAAHHSVGTVKGGDGLCPFVDCGRVIDGDEIKNQAQSGKMGEQLCAVVYTEQRTVGHTKSGKPKIKKVRGYRSPRPEDDVLDQVRKSMSLKMPVWQAKGIYPDEEMPDGYRKVMRDCIHRYGFKHWHEWFSERQLLGHCTSVEIFQDLLSECGGPAGVTELDRAAFTYIAIAIDKLLNYNARAVRWNSTRELVAGVFDRHSFTFLWSYAEMTPCSAGVKGDWAFKQTSDALEELIELTGSSDQQQNGLLEYGSAPSRPPLGDCTLTCESGDRLLTIPDASIDAVVIDPPYYSNVSYAELSDFFYVWLKRTAGPLFPGEFSQHLTDKDREAVANPWRFRSHAKGGKSDSPSLSKLSARDYQQRMQEIFREARRVLKPGGIMTLMFTHKATGAWDALARGLVDAGFVITASWPIQTEAEGSLHIKDKNAAKSTIFLVCRPRETAAPDAEPTYWENVEPKVTEMVAQKVDMFEALGMRGVDLYLSCFGPALEVFSKNWPITRGRPSQKPLPARGAQLQLLEDEDWDPYAVRPEDALMAARSAVKQWRLFQLSTVRRQAHLDPVSEFYVLAWDAYESPQFPADEALKLARVVGVNFDEQLKGKVLEVKGGDVILWDSSQRAKKGSLGSMGNGCKLDSLHHAAQSVRERNVGVARDMVEKADLHKDGSFLMALEAMLNVLPTPRMVSGSGRSSMPVRR